MTTIGSGEEVIQYGLYDVVWDIRSDNGTAHVLEEDPSLATRDDLLVEGERGVDAVAINPGGRRCW